MSKVKLVGEDEAPPPRKRLAQLLCYFCESVEKVSLPLDQDGQQDQKPGAHSDVPDGELMEREIVQLAKEQPGIFATDFETVRGSASQRRVPLACAVSF